MWMNYLGIRVRDVDRSLQFYRDLLGLEELGRSTNALLGGAVIVMLQDRLSKFRLELNWYPEGSQFASAYLPGEGLDHIGLRVKDVPRLVQRLTEAGYPPLDLRPYRPTPVHITSSGMTMAYVQDPNGIWIELYDYPDSPDRTAADGY
jgi:lactoylglutathione lyase